jgi:hypothetical protein
LIFNYCGGFGLSKKTDSKTGHYQLDFEYNANDWAMSVCRNPTDPFKIMPSQRFFFTRKITESEQIKKNCLLKK